MYVILKGSTVFMQSYNPTNIEVIEKKKNSQIVHRFYSSPEKMSVADKTAYRSALAKANSLCHVRGA